MDDPAPKAASLGRRLGSACYEALLLAAILFAATWVFLAVQPLLRAELARPLYQLYLLIVCGAYFIYCWTRGGQTLPMKTWRIRIVGRAGETPTTKQAALRYISALLSLALAGGGFLWALIDRDGQFLHDRLAGTRIVFDERGAGS
ncbi:MAG: hypothetical protein JWN94_4851 [Betaproteobacteria bacterium]|nr:hypothetical protein [Betaproteobacteria bacterium]